MTAAFLRSRKGVLGLGAAIALATVLVLVLAVATGPGKVGRDEAALADSEVVAVLQTTGRGYSDTLRTLLQAARADPGDAVAAKLAARALIDEGRAAGDTRLVGAALGILRPFLAANDAETLYLTATARQYQHDFKGALGLLDQAIALAPNDAGSILSRATIEVVLGRFDLATADCRRLGALRRIDLSLICQSTAVALTTQAPAAFERLKAVLAQGQLFGPDLEAYVIGLTGEIARLQGWHDVALADLTEALARNPNDVRVRMMLADELMDQGDPARALTQLDGAPEVDGVLLRRAIAAGTLGEAEVAGGAREELGRRVRLNLELGLTSHAREEARYFLQVAPDPALALARASVNWGLQREIEDAQLLIDAAVAAGQPAAATPVVEWLHANKVAVPTLRLPEAVRDAAR